VEREIFPGSNSKVREKESKAGPAHWVPREKVGRGKGSTQEGLWLSVEELGHLVVYIILQK